MEVPIKHFNKKKKIHKEDYIKWKRDTSIGYITGRGRGGALGGLHVQWSVSTETYSHHYRASGQSAQVGGIERSWRYLPRQHFLGLPFCLPCPLGRLLVWHSVKIVSTSLTNTYLLGYTYTDTQPLECLYLKVLIMYWL